jgi:biotin carboxylase
VNRVLVLGANRFYRRVLELLRDAGFYVLAVDRDPEAAARDAAHEFAAVDIADRDAVLAWASPRTVDGIMAVNDFGVRTASYVAGRLGLVGLSADAAERANDKGLMRDCWRDAGLPIPDYHVVNDRSGVDGAIAALGFPCVLKPTDCGGGGRGVSVLRSLADVDPAFAACLPFVQNDRFVVEAFVEGTEMTIETLSVGGDVVVLAMSDKTKPRETTRVATSLNYSAAFAENVLEKVAALTRRAVTAVGVNDGMAHTEIMVTPSGEPVLIELGARGGGGHIFHTIIELVSGVNAPVETARVLTRQTVTLPPIQRRGSVYRFFDTPKGILRAHRNLDRARELAGVIDVDIHKTPGTLVGDLRDSMYRVGYIVTAGATRDDAVAVADRVEALVEIDIEAIA